jgi:hypothetical protein
VIKVDGAVAIQSVGSSKGDFRRNISDGRRDGGNSDLAEKLES